MPKIQFSTLVTDMKGKSNGSTFSKNKGGNYFRTTRSGGGKKSPRWDAQKARFASLAGSWRNLSDEEQEAWNAAVSLYPTTNAFGLARLRSGYELYMHLNGALTGSGYPAINSPGDQREIPSTGLVESSFPDYFQLNPVLCFTNYNQNAPTAFLTPTAADFLDGVAIGQPQTFMARYQFAQDLAAKQPATKSMTLLSAVNGSGQGYVLQVLNAFSASATFRLTIQASGGKYVITTIDTANLLAGPFHVAIVIDEDLITNSAIYLNGILLERSVSTTGTPVTVDVTADLLLGSSDDTQNVYTAISDFRYMEFQQTAELISLQAQGYVIGTEAVIIPFYNNDAGTFANVVDNDDTRSFDVDGYSSRFKILRSCLFGLVPRYTISTATEGGEGFALNIYATGPVSAGKQAGVGTFKMMGSYSWNGVDEFDVSAAIAAAYANIPANAVVNFKVQVIDTQTGAVSAPQQAKPKKPKRFKAGSEMLGSVS